MLCQVKNLRLTNPEKNYEVSRRGCYGERNILFIALNKIPSEWEKNIFVWVYKKFKKTREFRNAAEKPQPVSGLYFL